MADLAHLGLAIDSRPATQAAAALDRMAEAAARGESRVGQIRTAADALIAALNRNTAATESLTAKMIALEAAGGKAGAALTSAGAAAGSAAGNVVRLNTAAASTKAGLDSIALSARSATGAWAALGAMGAATAARLEVARRMSAASAVPIQAGGGPGRAPFSRAQQANLGNLAQQGADVAVTAGMGMSPFMIALQQGPQIMQSFAGPGALKLSEIFSAAGDKAGALAARVGLVGGAIAGLTTTVIAGVAAQQSYSMTQIDLAQKLSGVGRASGATAGQINAIAAANADAGNVSVRSARAMAGEFAATGRIGAEMYAGLIGTAKDYAATTGQEMPEATKALAAAFADPAKGAETLNRQLGFLDAATRSNINNLSAQGDRLGAQKVLFEAYKGSLTSATELTSAWGRVTGAVGKTVSDAWDSVGSVVDRVVTGGDLETQVATAEKVLAASRARQAYLPFGMGERDTRLAQANLDRLRAEQTRDRERSQGDALKQRTLVVDDLVKQFNPAQERVKQLEQAATRIRAEMREGVLDPDGRSLRTAEGLEAAARRIREDMTQGGTQFANAIREAQFGLRTVGFSPQAQRVAGINERAENEIRALQADPNDPLLRDYQINAIRERARIELETAKRETTLTENRAGGAYSRMSPEVQAQLQAGSNRFGRIPLSWLAAIAEIESNGNLDVGYTKVLDENGKRGTAYGLGQVTRSTGDDLLRRYGIDRMNRATMGEALAGVLDMKLDAVGGDPARAVMAYRGSRDPAINRGYLAEVMRKSGELGDVSAVGQAREQDARTRGLQIEEQTLRITTEAAGRNREGMLARIEAMKAEEDARGRGIIVTREYAAQLAREAQQRQSILSDTRFQQYAQDASFQREQIGRTAGEARGAYVANSMGYDLDSPKGLAIMETERMNEGLRQTRALATDAFSGMLTDLRRGGDLVGSLSNMTGRLADRFLSLAADKTIASLFASGGGPSAEGGVFASIAKFFSGGFSAGGYTGPGGVMQPAGIVHAGEVVWSQRDVARVGGVSAAEAIRQGLRGYASGGPVYDSGRYSPPVWMAPPANSSTAAPVVFAPNIINNASGVQVSTRETTDERGQRRPEIVIDEMTAAAVGRPGSRTSRALAQPRVATR